MPITITPSPFGGLMGPGLGIKLQSSLIGPLPTGTNWNLAFFDPRVTPIEQQIAGWSMITQQNPITVFSFDTRVQTVVVSPDAGAVQDGQQVSAVAELRDQSQVVVDTGSQTGTWSNTAGTVVQLQQQQQTGGGLTPVEAQQLQDVHDATAVNKVLDALTTIELTSGPQGGNVSAFLPDSTWGLLIRIATFPPELVPDTPDGDYWFPSLAVVRLFRGTDVWKRIPIHRSSQLISFIDESVVAAVSLVTATQWLLNMSVQVDFRTGVTGQVFKLRFP